jgi:hypothetical protein
MLDAIEEALDQVARRVHATVVATLCLAIRTRRNDNLRAEHPNLLHEGVEVVTLVSDNRSCVQMLTNLVGDLLHRYCGYLIGHSRRSGRIGRTVPSANDELRTENVDHGGNNEQRAEGRDEQPYRH